MYTVNVTMTTGIMHRVSFLTRPEALAFVSGMAMDSCVSRVELAMDAERFEQHEVTEENGEWIVRGRGVVKRFNSRQEAVEYAKRWGGFFTAAVNG